MKNVLLIEDDLDIKDLLEIHLRDMGCRLTMETNGKKGYELARATLFDLIILDVMLPEKDGIDICRDLRANQVLSPILMLTARSEEVDKIIGLETGADDYLTKPFSVREFLARIKALFRRVEMLSRTDEEHRVLTFGDLLIDKNKRKVLLHNDRVDLTPKEFDLLYLLASNPGNIYPRDRLLRLIWGFEYEGYEHTVNSHINRLRSKIEPDLSSPTYILTSWGVGYRFNDELF